MVGITGAGGIESSSVLFKLKDVTDVGAESKLEFVSVAFNDV